MNRIISFAMTAIIALSFSTLLMAQQKSSQMTSPAKTEQHAKVARTSMMASTKTLKLNKEEIIALQNALSKEGLYKGKMDGVWGKKSRLALRTYQKNNHLTVTGEPNQEVLNRLGITNAAESTLQATKPMMQGQGANTKPETAPKK